MAIIPKIENGNVVIVNEYGGKLRSFSPNQGGKAVFVDYDRSNGKILVTTERGIVIVCNENGGHLNSFSGNGNIAMARWQGNDIFIQIINIFKNMYYKYFQELNKFMFENTKESEALLQSSLSSSDSHSKLYHYLTHQNDLDLNELMTTFTDGNKKRFQSYLQKRDRERKRKEAAQYSKKES